MCLVTNVLSRERREREEGRRCNERQKRSVVKRTSQDRGGPLDVVSGSPGRLKRKGKERNTVSSPSSRSLQEDDTTTMSVVLRKPQYDCSKTELR